MNIPNSLKDQIEQDYFLHDKILVVYFSTTTFDAVETAKKSSKGAPSNKQFMSDLPACTEDIDAFKEAMTHYGATMPEDCYKLHNADWKTCNKTFRDI